MLGREAHRLLQTSTKPLIPSHFSSLISKTKIGIELKVTIANEYTSMLASCTDWPVKGAKNKIIQGKILSTNLEKLLAPL